MQIMSTSMDFAITLINKVKEKEKQFTTEMSVLYYTLLAIRIGKAFLFCWGTEITKKQEEDTDMKQAT